MCGWSHLGRDLRLMFTANSHPIKINSSPHGQNGLRSADDILRYIFANEKFCILISLKFVPKGPIDNNPDNGLTLNRRQAIIGTKADPINWHMYVALAGDELSFAAIQFLTIRSLQICVQATKAQALCVDHNI